MEKYVVDVQNGQASNPIRLADYLDQNHLSNLSSFSGGYTTWIVWGVILVAVLVLIKKSIFTVQQQSFKVIERLGKFNKIAEAGLNFKIPFVDSVVYEGSLKVQQLTADVTAKSKDNSFINIPVKVQIAIDSSKVKESYYALSKASEQITSYIENIVRSTATTMTMEEIFQSKNEFEKDVQEALTVKFSGFGFEVVNVLVDNPMPSQEVVQAFNKVISSQRLKEAAQNEAEAIKVKTIGLAQAEAESLILKAKAYKEQRTILAEFFEQLPQDARAYLVGMDYRDMVRESSRGNGTVIIVPSAEAGNDISQVISGLKSLK